MSRISITNTDPIARSNLYRLFSLGFRYPVPAIFRAFQNGEFSAGIRDNISLLPHLASMAEYVELIMKVEKELESVTFADFEVKFVRTFDAGAPLPPCPPYEGLYREEPRTSILLEISEFYRYFGLAMSREKGKREFPDHLCAELEFLHFLTFKEAEVVGDGNAGLLRGYLLAEKDFLERHPMQWVPKFYDKLQSSECMPFYVRLAQITSMFIACELELITSILQDPVFTSDK